MDGRRARESLAKDKARRARELDGLVNIAHLLYALSLLTQARGPSL